VSMTSFVLVSNALSASRSASVPEPHEIACGDCVKFAKVVSKSDTAFPPMHVCASRRASIFGMIIGLSINHCFFSEKKGMRVCTINLSRVWMRV